MAEKRTNGNDGNLSKNPLDTLIDLDTARAYGGVSRSTWRRLVAKGAAPAPLDLPIASHRWRRSEVLSFWGLLPESGS